MTLPLVNAREVIVLLPFFEISLVPGDRPGPFLRMPLHCSLISWTSGVGSVWLEITVHNVFSLIYNVTLTLNHLNT
jgi:hypothetical protein